MARTLKWAGYEEAANRSLKWGLRQFTEKGFLPEHISKFEEFLEWRENEPDVNSSIKAAIKEAQKNVRKWRWDKKENSIVH